MSIPGRGQFALGAAAVAIASVGCVQDRASIERGGFRVYFDAEENLVVEHHGEVRFRSMAVAEELSSDTTRQGMAYGSPTAAKLKSVQVEERYSFFRFREDMRDYQAFGLRDVRKKGDALVARYDSDDLGEVLMRLSIEGEGNAAHVKLHLSLNLKQAAEPLANAVQAGPAPTHRVAYSFACAKDERFFGGGAQVTHEHTGKRLPIWVSDQGVGKLDYGKHSPFLGLPGEYYESYAPVPFVLSNRQRALSLVGTARSELELCTDGRDALRVQMDGSELEMWLFAGASPAELLEAYTATAGRMAALPRWAYAPWVDSFGGPAGVRKAAADLESVKAPTSAIWAEDWVGVLDALGGENLSYNWEQDRSRYPDLRGLSAELKQQGLALFTYLNPFLAEGTRAHKEAKQRGFLVEDASGVPMQISFPFGAPLYLWDPTTEGSVNWFHGYLRRMEALGVRGWMADYGEAMPYLGVLADGRTGPTVHNAYPGLWAKANADYVRKSEAELLYFTRSAHTGTVRDSPIHWLGDQLTSFDRNDGLGSVVPLYLSAGLSGIPLSHSDVGGYTFAVEARDYELYARWLALEAFTPILRTHHGSAPDRNVQWNSETGTLALWKRFSSWHQRLTPYFEKTVDQAVRNGTPTVRPLFWDAPAMDELYDIDDSFLSGDDLLVAPVVERSQSQRSVLLPPGQWRRWRHFDSVLMGGVDGRVTADAPIENAVVFVRAGAVLPLLARDYRSLLPSADTLDVEGAAPEKLTEATLLLSLGGESRGALKSGTLAGLRWEAETAALAGVRPEDALRWSASGEEIRPCKGNGATTESVCAEGDSVHLGASALEGQAVTLSSGPWQGQIRVWAPGFRRVTVRR